LREVGEEQREREREKEHEWGGAEGEGERENPEADFLLSGEPDIGLDPRTLRS